MQNHSLIKLLKTHRDAWDQQDIFDMMEFVDFFFFLIIELNVDYDPEEANNVFYMVKIKKECSY